VVWLCAAGVAEAAVLNVLTGVRGSSPGQVIAASVVEDAVLLPGLLAGAWALGGRLRESRDRLAALAEARAAEERRVALEVQARLARDLHDVAAHHLSSLVMQAEALRAEMPVSDSGAMEVLADTGRRAMDEMRALLGVLRADTSGSAGMPAASGEVLDSVLPV
jgi:signal transduction histidine kinase